ncbi:MULTISPECIES: hypothetical protein [Pseudomonadota]|uniref:hypothetical protein n=1 Tax=Pseudomonadota TaxID=1224 RepID=UPI0003160BEA|nr:MULTISPECIES: hypothetical protein [Pseudomonadota]HCK4605724.1 hypothetical protein [Pseudomonas aeruginosa]
MTATRFIWLPPISPAIILAGEQFEQLLAVIRHVVAMVDFDDLLDVLPEAGTLIDAVIRGHGD